MQQRRGGFSPPSSLDHGDGWGKPAPTLDRMVAFNFQRQSVRPTSSEEALTMKKALRILTVLLAAAILPVAASAETRGKTLKRAEGEMRKANFTEAEKIYRRLLEKDQTDKEARLGLSFTLIKQIKLQEAYENAAQVIAADPLNSRGFA